MTDVPFIRAAPSTLSASDRIHVKPSLIGPLSLVLAPVALGLALQVNYGQYDPPALVWLTAALFACFIANQRLASDELSHDADNDGLALRVALGIGLAIQFWTLLTTSPMATLVVHSGRDLLPFRIGIIVAAGAVAMVLMPSAATDARRQRIGLIVILLAYFLLGLWVLRVAPPPPVDVCLFQREACRALLHGHNPYAITFPIPYNDPARVYGPGTFADGRLLFGYPYPPLSLLMIAPGYLLGDFRLAHLGAMTLAGGLIALARPGRIATAAAALFLFTPRGFFVLEAGWTEPLAILMLTGAIFSAQRGYRSAPVWFGLLLATKQYLILVAPLAWLFHRLRTNSKNPDSSTVREEIDALHRPNRHSELASPRSASFWLAAGIVPAILSLPPALWNLPAFLRSAVLLQFHQPMRMDALSYSAWFTIHTGMYLPTCVPFLAAGLAMVMAIRPRNKNPASFPAGVALVFLVFFALNKQAFCNYYLFVIGAMCCAISASGPNESSLTDRVGR